MQGSFRVECLEDMWPLERSYVALRPTQVSLLLSANGAPLWYSIDRPTWTELVWCVASFLALADGDAVQVTLGDYHLVKGE